MNINELTNELKRLNRFNRVDLLKIKRNDQIFIKKMPGGGQKYKNIENDLATTWNEIDEIEVCQVDDTTGEQSYLTTIYPGENESITVPVDAITQDVIRANSDSDIVIFSETLKSQRQHEIALIQNIEHAHGKIAAELMQMLSLQNDHVVELIDKIMTLTIRLSENQLMAAEREADLIRAGAENNDTDILTSLAGPAISAAMGRVNAGEDFMPPTEQNATAANPGGKSNDLSALREIIGVVKEIGLDKVKTVMRAMADELTPEIAPEVTEGLNNDIV